MSLGSHPTSLTIERSSVGSRKKVDKVKGPGGKLLVILTEDGCVAGPNAATFSTRSSEAVSTCVPINSSDWRTVDVSFKDDIWTKILLEQNPGAKIRRVDLWYRGQIRADSTILESSKKAYEKVKEADARLKETSCEDENRSISVEIDSDALHEVFGPEKKNRVRAVSSTISTKKLQQSSLAKSVLVGPRSEIAEVKGDVAALKDDVAGLKNNVKSDIAVVNNKIEVLTDMLMTYFRQNGSEQLPSTPNSRTEIGSTSVNPPNPNVHRSSQVTPIRASKKVNPLVKLLNNEGTIMATGFIESDDMHAKVCHGRKVGLGEKKVYIENVLISQAPVYTSPENGIKVLEDIIEGGYLILLECWLQY